MILFTLRSECRIAIAGETTQHDDKSSEGEMSICNNGTAEADRAKTGSPSDSQTMSNPSWETHRHLRAKALRILSALCLMSPRRAQAQVDRWLRILSDDAETLTVILETAMREKPASVLDWITKAADEAKDRQAFKPVKPTATSTVNAATRPVKRPSLAIWRDWWLRNEQAGWPADEQKKRLARESTPELRRARGISLIKRYAPSLIRELCPDQIPEGKAEGWASAERVEGMLESLEGHPNRAIFARMLTKAVRAYAPEQEDVVVARLK